MSGILNVLVCGRAPDGSEANEQLRLLAQACYLRSDTRVSSAWLLSGPGRAGWRRSAHEQLVLDDLRTWRPAVALERVSPFAAGKLRGLRARTALRRIGRPDVVIADRAVGKDLIDRLAGQPRCVVAAYLGDEAEAQSDVTDLAVDSVLARTGTRRDEGTASTIVVPWLYDGSWARPNGLPAVRSATRRVRSLGDAPLIVGRAGAGDDLDRAADLLTTMALIDARCEAEGLDRPLVGWYGAAPGTVEAEKLLTMQRTSGLGVEVTPVAPDDLELLGCADIVVQFGAREDDQIFDAFVEAVGSVHLSVPDDIEATVSEIVAALGQIDEEARGARMEDARRRLDPIAVAGSIIAELNQHADATIR